MKSAIFFITGAVLGAVGGYFVTKYICEAKTEQKIAEVTAEARDFYREKYKEDAEKAKKAEEKEKYEQLSSSYRTYQSDNENRIFGNSFPVSNSTPIRDSMVNYREHPVDSEGNKTYLYMVDPDEAGMDENYTQYALDYYQDGNLVDEQGNLVDNPLEIVGDYLDELSLDNPEIYVRNDVTKTEYDICYVAASYEQPGGMYD